jgi:AcrR family transcriptional regulator
MQEMSTPTRSYVSSIRAAAAAEKRRDVIDAAARFLREEPSIGTFSLDAIAKRAGVTRLTVYNQFGSRRGLLEEVFDDLARRGGLVQLSDAICNPDPWLGLDHLVEIFCGFWSGDAALGRLQDAGALDPEFAQAVQDRNERRRSSIRAILRRTHEKQSPALERDAADLIFALTSYATYRSLSTGRKAPAVCALLKTACRDAAGPVAVRLKKRN